MLVVPSISKVCNVGDHGDENMGGKNILNLTLRPLELPVRSLRLKDGYKGFDSLRDFSV